MTATVVLGSTAPPAAGQDTLAVGVYVDNRAFVSREQLAIARRETVRIYDSAAVTLVWLDRRTRFSGTPLTVSVLTGAGADRLVPSSGTGLLRLGLALPGARRAYVHFDRVKRVASRWHVDSALLLGRVVAHELYHILVKTHDHAVSGLMAAEMSPDNAATPKLSSFEAKEVRDAVAQIAAR